VEDDLFLIALALVFVGAIIFLAMRSLRRAKLASKDDATVVAIFGGEVWYLLVTVKRSRHGKTASVRSVVATATTATTAATPEDLEAGLHANLAALGFALVRVVTLFRTPDDERAKRRASYEIEDAVYDGVRASVNGLELWLDAKSGHGAWSIDGVASPNIAPRKALRSMRLPSKEPKQIHFEDLEIAGLIST